MQRWDIFCRIIDNYGDIGVTWRLARQLAAEHGKTVRLWIDAMDTAAKLVPGLDPSPAKQVIGSVEICQWQDADHATPADVVIEAFACELPSAYLGKMAAKQPAWLNLEYLSAEPWIEGFHAQASRHPTLPLSKYFYFPGFTPKTGGLLRERDLIAQRKAFAGSPEAQQAFRAKLHIPDSEALKVSLFCYPHAPLPHLLHAFSQSPTPMLCLVPQSGIWPAISQHFDTQLRPGDLLNQGNLTLLPLPFLTQEDYDRLLWLCDINFVRGEDSWVRAIWAGKPMVWQPYRQQENTHLEKLAAFLNVYVAGSNPAASAALRQCHESWSSNEFPEPVWRNYLEQQPALVAHAASFADKLATESDLASKLVIFVEKFAEIQV